MSVRCEQCQTENPDNGHFCIECGTPLRPAAIGATERLPDAVNGRTCAACSTVNPAQAVFCVNCGRSLEATVDAPRPTMPAMLDSPQLPTAPLPTQQSAPIPGGARFNAGILGGVSGGLFLIGIAVLFVTGWWWPGILVLAGISALLSAGFSGDIRGGVIGGSWLLGLAVIAQFGWWWPGILVLVGLTSILGALLQATVKHRHAR